MGKITGLVFFKVPHSKCYAKLILTQAEKMYNQQTLQELTDNIQRETSLFQDKSSVTC